jgi:hypothetical protein
VLSLLAESAAAVHVPDNRSLLEVWESSRAQAPAQRALSIAAIAGALDPEQAGSLTLGGRDGLLLGLREALFGSRMDCVADCPACGEPVELTFSVDDVRLAPHQPPPQITVALAGHDVEVRLPTAADLATVAGVAGDDPYDELLARCLPLPPPEGLSPAAAETLAAALAAADPQADVQLGLDCPSCEHHWSAPFDIAGHLLDELDAWAEQMLWGIHVLALAYGWSEEDTLRLSATRRHYYLEAVGW